MRLVWRSADGAEQNDLGKLTQEPKSPKCINMLVLLNKKKKVTKEGKDLWKINKQQKKKMFLNQHRARDKVSPNVYVQLALYRLHFWAQP